MNNSNAIDFLLVTRLKGFFRNLLRNKISLLITILVIIATGFGFINSLNNPAAVNFQLDVAVLNVIGGAMLYLILIVMVFNKRNALVYGNDANYIFAGPFQRKQIYTYITILSYAQSIFIALGFVFYVLIFFSSSIKGLPHILGLILSTLLHFNVITFYFNYEYMREASKDEPKHINRAWIGLISFIMVGMVIFLLYPEFSFTKLMSLPNEPLFKFIPFVGTFSWIGNMFVINDLSGWFIILFLVLVSLIILVLTYRFDGNFIEKAISDAEFLSSRMKEAKEGKEINNLDVDVDKIKNRKIKSRFLSGGLAILSKQYLILKKTRRLIPVMMLIYLAAYGVAAFLMQDVEFFMIMIVFSLFLGNDNTLLMDELKKPYIYLIPDNELKKLLSTILIPFIRVAILQLFNLVILIVLGRSWIEAILFYFFVLSCYLVILMVDCVSIKIMRGSKNAVLQAYLKMFLYLISFVPTTLLVLGFMFLTKTTQTEPLFLVATGFNILYAFIGLWFAQSILKGNNLYS